MLLTVFDTFYQNLMATTMLEVVAVVMGLASVWFAKKENILVYPTGIISVLIYVYICFFAQLYADMGINFFYFVMSVYGWYMWTRKDQNKKNLAISVNSPIQQWMGLGITLVAYFAILGSLFYLKQDDAAYIDSYTPYIDSFTTAIFLVGMWLMALKKVENWIYWIIGDVISIPLYLTKGLVFTSFQYTVFLILAVMGYLEWRKRFQSCSTQLSFD